MPVPATELARLFQLDTLRPETRDQLAREAMVSDYQRGENVFEAGDLDDDTVYLLDGELKCNYPDGRSVSFAELGALTATAEAELRELDVRPGDRVMVVAENCPEHAALILACSRVGAWSCGVNARMAPGEIDAFAGKADARVVYFTAAASRAALAALAPEVSTWSSASATSPTPSPAEAAVLPASAMTLIRLATSARAAARSVWTRRA